MNIHFSELLLIVLVAILVIKPEQLPRVALQLGRWFKRMRQITAKLKTVVDQPVMGKYSFHDGKKESLDHE